MFGWRKHISRAIGGSTPPIALLALVALVLAPGCERRPVGRGGGDEGPVVARVNGQPLYLSDLESYLPEAGMGELTAEERKAHFDRWLATQLLYEEAQRSGLQMSRDLDRKIEQYRKDLVADRLVQEVLRERAVVSRDEVIAYYRAHKDEYNLEARVSHILTNNIEDAIEAQQLLKTRPFSFVARKLSVDRHTGAGGDLGYLSKGNMPPEFEDVVFKMRVGQVSDIIESEFGYHIIKLTDLRAALDELPLDAVAPDISRTLLLAKREAAYDSLLSDLRARARIDIMDADLRYAVELADSLEEAKQAADRAGEGFRDAVPEPRAKAAAPDTAAADTLNGEPE
jgi:parvulin-like peptidyl-prolyl isomerase